MSVRLVIQYEGKIVEWLLSQKDSIVESVEPDTAVDSLAVKILTEKFNTRYGELLNEEQRNIIKNYVFSIQSGNDNTILEHLRLIKENTLETLNAFRSECENKILSEKIEKVYSNVFDLPCDAVDDETIKRFLTVSQLKSEIKEYSEVQNG